MRSWRGAPIWAELLDLLASGVSHDEMRARLSRHGEPYASYVSRFDDRALDVGTALVEKWGRRVE